MNKPILEQINMLPYFFRYFPSNRIFCHNFFQLQPNPRLSATRNQLRQKLAKFSSSDFAHLIIDLLKEIRRRHFGLPLPTDEQPAKPSVEIEIKIKIINLKFCSSFFHDANLDETDSQSQERMRLSTTNETNKSNNVASTDDQNLTFTSLDNYLELKEKWLDSNDKMEQLTNSNTKILKYVEHISAGMGCQSHPKICATSLLS
jgi:hypothetical protein